MNILCSKLRNDVAKIISGKGGMIIDRDQFLRLLELRRNVEEITDDFSLDLIKIFTADLIGDKRDGYGSAEVIISYKLSDVGRNLHININFKFNEIKNIYYMILAFMKVNLFSKVFFDVVLPYYLFMISFFVAVRNAFSFDVLLLQRFLDFGGALISENIYMSVPV